METSSFPPLPLSIWPTISAALTRRASCQLGVLRQVDQRGERRSDREDHVLRGGRSHRAGDSRITGQSTQGRVRHLWSQLANEVNDASS